jgi:hypothetical protein
VFQKYLQCGAPKIKTKTPVQAPMIQGAMTPLKAASPLLGIFRHGAIQRQTQNQ